MYSTPYSCQILRNFSVLDRFSKNTQIQNFTKIRLVGTELLHSDRRTDGRTDRHDEADSHFRNFAKAPKNYVITQNSRLQHVVKLLVPL